ncbi:MAG: GGDEF domain-containing protein [Gammaproteobacteria bacterium]
MAQDSPLTSEISLSHKVLKLLDSLKESQVGAAVYQHIEQMLDSNENNYFNTLNGYAELLNELLDCYTQILPQDSIYIPHIKLLKLRLTPPVSISEINGLLKYIEGLRPLASLDSRDSNDFLDNALSPLLSSFGISVSAAPNSDITKPNDALINQPIIESTNDEQANEAREINVPKDLPDTKVDMTYRKHLDEKRARIQKIQETLAQHVTEVVKQNEKFGVLLEVESEALRQTEDMTDLENLKNTLINEVEKLLDGHHALASKLDSANKYLQIIETEGQHLNEELTRVHILSLTDELTDLPNRRAFMRRLEDEVARVQRYGYQLSLALIDLDGFKAINDKLGHAAGDIVLQNFSANILSTFRHHDMVARYGGEEFAVLLPNTDIEGSHRALEKVKARAANSTFQTNGSTLAMPTFSAGISLYKPGETPGNLIERADQALYRAKRMGRNRIELANQDQDDTEEAPEDTSTEVD